MAPQKRADVLRAAEAVIRRRAPEIRAMIAAEIGATAYWQDFNLDVAIGHLQAAADLVQHLAPKIYDEGRERQIVTRQAVGVCLAIAPWNAPFVLAMRAVAYALACGNAVVLKASEMCPATHLLVADVLAEAGLPEGVLQVITHAPEEAAPIVTALIEHEAVRRVNFTGSTRVGRLVAGLAARQLKRCLLELGGKDAMVVLEDADLEAAADAAAYGGFLNQGQVCMSTQRVVVMEKVADAFVAKLVERAGQLSAGDPAQHALGPLVNELAASRVEQSLRAALGAGAQLLTGGVRRGTYIEATVLDHVTPGMAIYGEECFGPIISVCRAQTEAEAISIVNDTRYGLTAAVFGRNVEHAMKVAAELETGMCHINGPTINDRPDMPVGGMKDSGYGRFGGASCLDEFTELRWFSQSDAPRSKNFAAWASAPPARPE